MDEFLAIAPILHLPEPNIVVAKTGKSQLRASQIDRSPEARQRRAEAARAAVARMKAIHNDPDEDDGEFLRELDEANPGRFDLERFYTDGPDPA